MDTDKKIEKFLSSKKFGVAGASADRNKYGNKVLRCYQMNNLPVIPINPKVSEIEGITAVASVKDLPEEVESLSIITPPLVTERIVGEAIAKGIKNIWMQIGSESEKAIELCERAGINTIADGSCILVVLGYREH
ncbi:MAG: CoA-binding protein [Desulfuromonadales bacterium]|nr:CoA-binding protein [Desulfuromonadales bacterium]